jgi:hypothetical protein
MQYFLAALIAIFTIVIGFLPTEGKLRDRRKNGLLRQLSKSGWAYFVFAALAIIAAVGQIWVQNASEAAASKKNQRNQQLRDSINNMTFQKFILQRDSIIADNLGKYGYRLDSVTGMLVSLRDSVKTTIVEPDKPVFQIAPGGMPGQPGIKFTGIDKKFPPRYKYDLRFMSCDASSCCYNLKMDVIIASNGLHLIKMGSLHPIDPTLILSKNELHTSHLVIPSLLKYDTIFLWIRGTYKGVDRREMYRMNTVYYCCKKDNSYGDVMGPWRKRIIDFVKR